MNSQATSKFWKFYNRLPHHVQRQARKAYQLWVTDIHHPSLHFKRVDDQDPIYSARVSDSYRVLGFVEGNTIIWYWIGTHDEYDRLLK